MRGSAKYRAATHAKKWPDLQLTAPPLGYTAIDGKRGFPDGTNGKEPACQHRRHKRCRFSPWVGKIQWSRKWHLSLAFLPGKFHGQRSLAGYTSWGPQRVMMPKQLSVHAHPHTHRWEKE